MCICIVKHNCIGGTFVYIWLIHKFVFVDGGKRYWEKSVCPKAFGWIMKMRRQHEATTKITGTKAKHKMKTNTNNCGEVGRKVMVER